MTREKITENFYRDEFDCKCGCGLNTVSEALVKLLQEIREISRVPMVVTSGMRCKDHNAREGGKATSDHLLGLAVDVACSDAQIRRALVRIALSVGVPTIGIKKDCLHFSMSLPARIFSYD